MVTRNAYVGMGKDSIKVDNVLRPDTLWLGADTLETQMVLRQTLKLISRPVIKKDNEIGSEAVAEGDDAKAGKKKKTVAAKASALKEEDKKVAAKTNDKKGKNRGKKSDEEDNPPDKKQADSLVSVNASAVDSLKQLAVKPDSLQNTVNATADSSKNIVKNKVVDSVKSKVAAKVINPLDTVKARSIKAYHNVRVYKSNLQAVSDSLFYTSADSTLRWFNNPIMWAEGSQQTGDTIYLQMRNAKLSSVQIFQTAFSVNVEKDSARFNQVKGKVMTGFFKEGKIQSLYVDGNAESIYFTKDDKDVYKEMNQTVSSRLKITFKDDAIADLVTIKDAESAITPLSKLKEDVYLTGFIWKPELRPLSKRDITKPKTKKVMPGYRKGPPAAKEKSEGDEDSGGTEKKLATPNDKTTVSPASLIAPTSPKKAVSVPDSLKKKVQ